MVLSLSGYRCTLLIEDNSTRVRLALTSIIFVWYYLVLWLLLSSPDGVVFGSLDKEPATQDVGIGWSAQSNHQ